MKYHVFTILEQYPVCRLHQLVSVQQKVGMRSHRRAREAANAAEAAAQAKQPLVDHTIHIEKRA